jgi:hypothetical protein
MKMAVSVPVDVFERAERLARRGAGIDVVRGR